MSLTQEEKDLLGADNAATDRNLRKPKAKRTPNIENLIPKGTTGERCIFFIEKFCKHSKGETAGQLIKLSEWQKNDIILPLFDTLKENGQRRYKKAFIAMARKNGKTLLISAICLYLLLYLPKGQEIYLAANSRDQSGQNFENIVWMIRQDKILSKLLKINESTKRIAFLKKMSFIRAISSEVTTAHGFNASIVIADELHIWPSRDLLDVLETSMGVRKEPLLIIITTMGVGKINACRQLYDYSKAVQAGVITDPTFFSKIYELEPNADWKDEAKWEQANPALGEGELAFRNIEELKEMFLRAKEVPAYENTFKQFYLNMWVEQLTRWMPIEKWDECSNPPECLEGMSCYAGLDLATTTDVTAFVLIFPNNDFYDVLPFFFLPENAMKERDKRDHVGYTEWVRRGLIFTTPGDEVDYAFVIAKIKELAEKYDIEEIAFDRWGATKISQDLIKEGAKMIPFGQGYQSMSPPTKELMKLVLEKKIRHGANPVLRWMASNIVIATDPAGNIKPNKAKASEKIDGITAMIMGLDRALRHESKHSIYETKDLFVI